MFIRANAQEINRTKIKGGFQSETKVEKLISNCKLPHEKFLCQLRVFGAKTMENRLALLCRIPKRGAGRSLLVFLFESQ